MELERSEALTSTKENPRRVADAGENASLSLPKGERQPRPQVGYRLNVPVEVAFLWAIGKDHAIDGDGRFYTAPPLDDDARKVIGYLAVVQLMSEGDFVLAELVRDQLAKRWPGCFKREDIFPAANLGGRP